MSFVNPGRPGCASYWSNWILKGKVMCRCNFCHTLSNYLNLWKMVTKSTIMRLSSSSKAYEVFYLVQKPMTLWSILSCSKAYGVFYLVQKPMTLWSILSCSKAYGVFYLVQKPMEYSILFKSLWLCGVFYLVQKPMEYSILFKSLWLCGVFYLVQKSLESHHHPIESGVWQESVLSPALFLNYHESLTATVQQLRLGATVNGLYAGTTATSKKGPDLLTL